MKSVWRRQRAVVRDVQADLLPHRQLAYTTVMTVMDRLFKKGVLHRTKKSRAHVYEPAFSESDARADAVTGLVDSFFGGAEHRLSEYLGSKPVDGEAEPASRSNAGPHSLDDSLL